MVFFRSQYGCGKKRRPYISHTLPQVIMGQPNTDSTPKPRPRSLVEMCSRSAYTCLVEDYGLLKRKREYDPDTKSEYVMFAGKKFYLRKKSTLGY